MKDCSACGETNAQDLVECQGCGELLVDIFGSGSGGGSGAPPDSEPLPDETPSLGVATDSPASLEDILESATLSGMTRVLPRLTRFGNRYEIIELIGEGGMGRVYKARDLELDREIALKIIRGESSGDPSVLKRFKQELLLARRITHKNVVRIYDLGEARGIKFFTMELIDGESLKDVIRKEGSIPVETVREMLPPMLSALAEAHEQEVIHRDLKPQNIMVSRDGMPHIMDFGIARASDTSTMTTTGSILGTPDYMSPEQVSGESTDAQSDLFSFGVILYEMLTGAVPYEADTAVAKVMMRLTQKPRPPRELNPTIPKYLEKVVLKCLDTDRELRYKNAAEVLEDLDREQVDNSLTLKAWRGLVRRRAGFAAAAALTLVVGGTTYLSRGTRATEPVVGEDGPVTTLVVLPFTNATGSGELEWMRNGLPEMVITDLSQSRYVRPVPGERVFKVLRELGVEGQTRFDESTLSSVTDMAPAQAVLYGQFVTSGEQFRMDLTLRQGDSGVPTPIKVEGQTSQIFAMVDEISERVKEQLDLSPEQLKGDIDRPIVEVSTVSLDALRIYQSGLEKTRAGANQEAIPFFTEATEADPNFAMAYAKLAEAYIGGGRYEDAQEVIARADELSESASLPLSERYQIHAIKALANNDFETATESYRELAKLYPEDPDIELSLAGALEELGEYPEAMKSYQRVVTLAPDYGAAILGLGRARVASGFAGEAIGSLKQALETGQFDDDMESLGRIHAILGTAYRDTGDLDTAMDYFITSLSLRRQAGDRGGEAIALLNVAAVYEFRGDIDEALVAENQALAISREIGDQATESMALLNIGLTYKEAGKLDEALDALRKSMRIEMEHQDATNLAICLDYIAEIYRRRGQYDDAMVYLEQAKTYLDRSGDKQEKAANLTEIGVVRKAQGQHRMAIDSLLAALPIFQEIEQIIGVAMVQLHLAEAYAEQGRYGDAYNAIQQGLRIYKERDMDSDMADAKARLGHLLTTLGQFDAAEKELSEAAQLAREAPADNHLPFILLSQSRLHRFQGREDEALAMSQSAQEACSRIGEKRTEFMLAVELGRIQLADGSLVKAQRILRQGKEDAAESRLRVIEAEAAAALARVYLAQGDAVRAEMEAQEAIRLAASFSGRPLLFELYGTLGEAYQLDRPEEARSAFSKAAETIEWILSSLLPEHSSSFLGLRQVRTLLEQTASRAATARAAGEVGVPASLLRLKK